jgi:L1 cell adhesion molecule like protein
MEYIIGIDLGTTNSCVGVWKNNKVDIIPVPETGDKITPSVVCFIHNEEIVGILSKNKSEQYYKSIIYDSKRLIGKKYNEIDKKELEVYPFEIEPDKENNIKIVIKVNEETKKFSPEEISSKILKKLKKDAEVYLGKEVEKAIITVPANFTENQRKSTIKAAELAGLNVLKTINEPTAAAVAYSFENKSEKERIICVFDFGGGTLDITILKNQGMKLNIISTLGDPHLGGQDIDNLLVHHFVQQLKNENNFNVSNNNKELMKLKNICENLKKDLSIRQETSIDYYFKNQEINIEMLRSEFDVLCKDLFSRCIKLLNECIKSSGLKKNEIEEVVLVGGSSRIPKIQEMIKEYFNNEINLCKSINPEEAVAYGAAFTAYKFNQKKNKTR